MFETVMGIIGAILIGLLIGVVAKLLMPGPDPGGVILTAILGIGGALVANFVGRSMGFYAPDEAAGFIASVLGAILILAAYRAVRPAPKARRS